MKRLTIKDTFRKRWEINNDCGAVKIDDLNYAIGEAVDRLAAFEEIGMEPEDLATAVAIARDLARADYPHNFQREYSWIVDYCYKMTGIQRQAKLWAESASYKEVAHD